MDMFCAFWQPAKSRTLTHAAIITLRSIPFCVPVSTIRVPRWSCKTQCVGRADKESAVSKTGIGPQGVCLAIATATYKQARGRSRYAKAGRQITAADLLSPPPPPPQRSRTLVCRSRVRAEKGGDASRRAEPLLSTAGRHRSGPGPAVRGRVLLTAGPKGANECTEGRAAAALGDGARIAVRPVLTAPNQESSCLPSLREARDAGGGRR